MLEAVGSSSGQAAAITAPPGQPPAETPETAGTWGWALTDLVLGSVPVRVACRCRHKVHDLDPLKLRELASAAVSGRPRGVGVSLVTADYHS